MTFHSIRELDSLTGKRALVRVDLNVPVQDGRVSDDTRIQALIPTVTLLLEKGARVILLSHFGRPNGMVNPEMSLKLLVKPLEDAFGMPVVFGENCIGKAALEAVNKKASITLLENLRFHKGETDNDPAFIAELAKLGDIYVNDAFSCAHRAHASTEGVAHVLPSYAGLSMSVELEALEAALGKPQRPVGAIVGGAKVSSKLDVLTNLIEKVDHLIIGGGMANTFLAAQGHDVGASLCEHDLSATANNIITKAAKLGCQIHLPSDVVVSQEFAANPKSLRTISLAQLSADEMILDVGPNSVKGLISVLSQCKTLIWNGPLGAFEMKPFDRATVALAKAAATRTQSGQMVSIAGGGDTVAALNQAGVKNSFSHVSTAGGAFLEWMEGKKLPGVEALG